MDTLNNIIIELTLSPTMNQLDLLAYTLLKEADCNDEEISFINTTGGKYLWTILLDCYIKELIDINEFTANLLRHSLSCINNLELEIELNKFLENPEKPKAIELYNKIRNDIPRGIYEECVKKLTEILQKVYIHVLTQKINTIENPNMINQR